MLHEDASRTAQEMPLLPKATNKRRKKRFTPDDAELLGLSLPAAVWYIAFCYVPLFGIIFAFKKYKMAPGKGFLYSLFVNSKWVGFNNFKFLFVNPQMGSIIANTLVYNIIFLLIGITLPVGLAIMISYMYSARLKKICQTATFLPHFLSWVIVSYFVNAFLSTDRGLVNSLLTAAGATPIKWYQETRPWPFILIFLNTWKTFGYSMVVYMASLAGIDQSLYESAVIDGATIGQQIRKITLPLLRPILSIMFILNIGHIFSSEFGLFYHVPRDSGSLISVTQTIDVYVYKALMEQQNYGYSAATSLLQNGIGCILIVITNIVVKRIDPESGLF